MKKLLTILILVLVFQNSSYGDDISNLEIEGMSIGNSLLDYISIQEISESEKIASFYKDYKFKVIFINKYSEKYERLQTTIKSNDKNFIIYSIDGLIDFENRINESKKEKEIIIASLTKLIDNFKRVNENKKHRGDESGESFIYGSWFFLDSGGFFEVSCTDYGSEAYKNHGWTDELNISITSEEFSLYLSNDAYN